MTATATATTRLSECLSENGFAKKNIDREVMSWGFDSEFEYLGFDDCVFMAKGG